MDKKINLKDDEMTKKDNIIASIVLNGDISKLSPNDKVKYYNMFCESLNLDPVTKPFQIIKFQGRETLYATKDATEQLRKLNNVSVTEMDSKISNDILIVQVKVQDKTGRTDISTGAVNMNGLKGDSLANAIMKAETKAKRRATLSICGLGILDESEIETIPGKKVIREIDAQDEKQKGDFKKAIQFIENVQDTESAQKMIDARRWTEEERDLLNRALSQKSLILENVREEENNGINE